MSDISYPPLYLRGIEYFNECDFFEAHEAWEDLWSECRDDSRKFYQGLIQAAVALHHFGNGNVRGAKKLYHSSSRYLEPYCPVHIGLDLEKFLAEFHACFADLLAIEEGHPAVEVVPDRIPEIHLDPIPD